MTTKLILTCTTILALGTAAGAGPVLAPKAPAPVDKAAPDAIPASWLETILAGDARWRGRGGGDDRWDDRDDDDRWDDDRWDDRDDDDRWDDDRWDDDDNDDDD